MRTNVAKDSPVLLRVPEPIGTRHRAAGSSTVLDDLVRRNVDGLDHFSDRALPHQFPRVNSGLHLQQLAVKDGVNPLGLSDGPAHIRQLFQRGHAGLVREEILAALHGTHSYAGSFAGDLRGQHQLHRRVVEDLILGLRDLYIGKSLAERRQFVFFAAPRRHKLSAAALHRANHAVDVVVADAADGKLDVIFGCFFGLRGHNRIFHSRAAPPPNAIAPSGRPTIIAAHPSEPTRLARFKNSRRCVTPAIISPPYSFGIIDESGMSAPWLRTPAALD